MTPNVELIGAEPLDSQVISDFLREFGGLWNQLEVFSTVDSTNTELARNISAVGSGHGRILAAEEQTGGLGRLGRDWSTEHGKGIALSLGVDASDVDHDLTALPLIVGVAVIRALALVGVSATLKWPNDIVFLNVDGSVRKCGGILVQRIEHALVIGIGLNVMHSVSQLPTPLATSLLVEGHAVSRNELVARIIREIESALTQPGQWIKDYLAVCSSIDREVIVHQLAGEKLQGKAISVLPSGALVLATDDAQIEVTIGDVEHATIS
ncbi:MAG: biotin--[acetyl-CoA-carboxylase] ligase [Actinomycetes bacterium]